VPKTSCLKLAEEFDDRQSLIKAAARGEHRAGTNCIVGSLIQTSRHQR